MAKITFEKPIKVDHLARIEGKAGIEVEIGENNEIEVKVNIFEGPRFFEAIAIGKPLEEATAVFPRVCSFCAAAHKVTGLRAAENAIGLIPTEQTQKLRELMYLGDHIESHALHLFLLALPDFLGYADALNMAKDHPKVMKTALNLKDVGARIQDIIGSRYIHQENARLGGFGKIPSKKQLMDISSMLEEAFVDSQLAITQFAKHELWPEITSERNHLALKPKNAYSIYGERVYSSDSESFKITEYDQYIKEKVVPHSFAKHCTFNNKPFATSALSRLTLFGDTLTGEAKELSQTYKEFIDPSNPLSNNIAQSVELVYFVHRAHEIAQELADNRKEEERVIPEFKAGTGYSVTEAPRGLLAYKIEVDKEGLVKNADVITPTAMFLAQKEIDLHNMTEAMIKKGIEDPNKISQKLETIVRSYDPCVSCSVHVTKKKKVEK